MPNANKKRPKKEGKFGLAERIFAIWTYVVRWPWIVTRVYLCVMRKVWVWGGAAAIGAVAACATATPPSGNEGSGGDAGNIPLYDAGNGGGDGGNSTTCTL